MTLPELLDVAGVAERCGLRRQTVRAYVMRGTLPPEDYRLNGGPVWRTAVIDAWQASRQRWGKRAQVVQRCQHRTTTGTQCTRPAVGDTWRCWQHTAP